MVSLTTRESALVAVGRMLRDTGYRFTSITPETHHRIVRRSRRATNLRDVFGWSRHFEPALLPPELLAKLTEANGVTEIDGVLKSAVRFSTLGDNLYVHSAFPTSEPDAVFFGPDTYRFCALIDHEIQRGTRVVDVCCGSGVGGIHLGDRVDQIVLADINPGALSLARVNAELAGVSDRVEIVEGDLLAGVRDHFDLVIANPPYLLDPTERVYRNGGGELGIGLGARIVAESVARLGPAGRLVLYSGAPIVDGEDRLRAAVEPVLAKASQWTYVELDPDVFGEELDEPAYANVERIAVIGATATV